MAQPIVPSGQKDWLAAQKTGSLYMEGLNTVESGQKCSALQKQAESLSEKFKEASGDFGAMALGGAVVTAISGVGEAPSGRHPSHTWGCFTDYSVGNGGNCLWSNRLCLGKLRTWKSIRASKIRWPVFYRKHYQDGSRILSSDAGMG